MSDLQVFIVHENQPASRAWARRLASSLERDFAKRSLEHETPEVCLVAGYTALPRIESLGALSPVLLLLPAGGRGFKAPEKRRLDEFRRAFAPGDDRIIPVPTDQASAGRPPSPVDDLVAADLIDPAKAAAVRDFATFILIKLCLRVPGSQRAVFVSYRTRHGRPWAEKIAAGLAERGYIVWRDENKDRDRQKMIEAGSKAQETIQQAIRDHGFVVVVDAPGAHLSTWVDEEVQCALKYSVPILPVVIEGGSDCDPSDVPVPPKQGGRFRALADEGIEVRITVAGQRAAGKALDTVNPRFVNRLERAMCDRLLELLRTQRRLVHGSREQVKRFSFEWSPAKEEPLPLLFSAVYTYRSDDSPGLALRFLVQCVPYGTVMEQMIDRLSSAVKRQREPHQYGLIVHQTGLSPADKRRLLEKAGGHMMVMKPDELERIPRILSIAARARS